MNHVKFVWLELWLLLLSCKRSMRFICVGMYACVWPIMHVWPRIRQIRKRGKKDTHTHAKIIIFHTTTSAVCSWQLFWIDFSSSMSFVAAAVVAAVVTITPRHRQCYHLNRYSHRQNITHTLPLSTFFLGQWR